MSHSHLDLRNLTPHSGSTSKLISAFFYLKLGASGGYNYSLKVFSVSKAGNAFSMGPIPKLHPPSFMPFSKSAQYIYILLN